MHDFSELVGWLAVVVGCGIAAFSGSRMTRPLGCGGVVAAAGLSCVLGIGMMFGASFLLSACVDAQLCISRGDVGLTYVFYSLFATPLYWVLAIMFPKKRAPA